MELFFEWELGDGTVLKNTVVNEGKDKALRFLLLMEENNFWRLTLGFTNRKEISVDDTYDINAIVGLESSIIDNAWEKEQNVKLGVRYHLRNQLNLRDTIELSNIYRLALSGYFINTLEGSLIAYSAILPGAPITIPANTDFFVNMSVGIR